MQSFCWYVLILFVYLTFITLCVTGICYEPICIGRTNGVYQDTTHACRRSYTCHSGKLTSIDNCPPHHLHNGQKCVDQKLVTCDLPQTTAIGFPFAGDQRCVGRSDGRYSIDDCSGYMECINQEVENVEYCGDGYLYDNTIRRCVKEYQAQSCTKEASIRTDIICSNKRDGFHFDPASTDCTSYIKCKDGRLESREQCSAQAVFNGNDCVPAPLFTCPSMFWDMLMNDICKHKNNGFYVNPQRGCASYLRCVGGRTAEEHDCPARQYFDPDERNCVFEKFNDRKKCLAPKLALDCKDKSQGFYQGEHCTSYYYCLNGYMTEYMCPRGKVFNGDKCVSKSHYTCPFGNMGTCNGKADGYHKDKDSGCRAYYFCSKGHKATYLCDEGHSFNGEKCVPTTCQQDYSCYAKSDGYHTDVSSNCRSYIYCQNGEKINRLTCRGDNVFNGHKCVDPRSYACPSLYNHRQLNCMPRDAQEQCLSDGFFSDVDSNCRNYFFCIGGKPSKLSCPDGRVFNGEVCVPKDSYSCPFYCN